MDVKFMTLKKYVIVFVLSLCLLNSTLFTGQVHRYRIRACESWIFEISHPRSVRIDLQIQVCPALIPYHCYHYYAVFPPTPFRIQVDLHSCRYPGMFTSSGNQSAITFSHTLLLRP